MGRGPAPHSIAVAAVALLVGPAAAGPFATPVERDRIDADACAVWVDGERRPIPRKKLRQILALGETHHRGLNLGRTPEKARRLAYRIAFREPVPVGSLAFQGGPGRALVLKPDAPYPGDPSKPAHWRTLRVPPQQSGARLATAPPGTRTRAVLLVHEAKPNERSRLKWLRIYERRLHNVAPDAHAYASRSYDASASHTFGPDRVVDGRGAWRSTGENADGRILSPPVSDVKPEWFMLVWGEAKKLEGLWLDDNFYDIALFRYAGPSAVHPRAATKDAWREIRRFENRLPGEKRHHGRWIRFEKPVETRGLRIRITAAGRSRRGDKRVAVLKGLHAYVDLGDRPVPERGASREPDRAPVVSFSYEIPKDGLVTAAIEGPDGRRVRNLFARREREVGGHTEGWNLRNQQGNFVSPGSYTWKAIWHPGLALRYEMTPYPNVEMITEENSPWLNSTSGSGGWMADHTPPRCVAAAGGSMYFGAPVAESGVSVIETNLEGVKQWGLSNFDNWTGATHLASDGETLVAAFERGRGDDRRSTWAVDQQTKKDRKLSERKPSGKRLAGIRGLAARDGRYCVSVRAYQSWLINAADASDVAIEHCVPHYKPAREPRTAHEVFPHLRRSFKRLFRLQGNPPGQNPDQGFLVELESTKGPEPRQHIVLAFKKPVPLGSVVFPVPQRKDRTIRLSVLKEDAPFPPKPDVREHWKPFPYHGKAAWDVAPAPPGTRTRALRVTFVRGKADIFTRTSSGEDKGGISLDGGDEGADASLGGGEAWKGTLEGMKLLRRRYRNVADEARVRVSSGEVASAADTWVAKRSAPLTRENPAVYVLEWDEARKLRGLAFKEIDGFVTEIDVHTGEGPVRLRGDKGWRHAATYRQQRRNLWNGSEFFQGHARYMDGYVPFDRTVETRAVRLRVVRQWLDNEKHLPGETGRNSFGQRVDRGGGTIDPSRCRIFGVAALEPIGGEPPVDPRMGERIEKRRIEDASLVKEVYVDEPSRIAYAPDGTLHVLSRGRIAPVDFAAGGTGKPLVGKDLEKPGAFAFDEKGNLYVWDGAAGRRHVRVYSPEGELKRTIGERGGFETGPWNPKRLGKVSDLAVDERGQLWIVERQRYPKRITCWSTDGTFKKELLGNTSYGGGGVLSRYDRSELFYKGLRFELDWESGETRLAAKMYAGPLRPPEVPIRHAGHHYLVTRPPGARAKQAYAVVYRREGERAIPAAAMGMAEQFPPLKDPAIYAQLGSPVLKQHRFRWTDRNADGHVQAEEIELEKPKRGQRNVVAFNRDMSIHNVKGGFCYTVKRVLESGVPVYQKQNLPAAASDVTYATTGTGVYRLGDHEVEEAVLDRDGTPRWTYDVEGRSVHGYKKAGPYTPEQVVGVFKRVGHERAEKGELGEFFVFNADHGSWYLWTADGLLASRIFRDLRTGPRRWRMERHARGMSLTNVTTGQEHFQGWFTKTSDGRYYAVAGHNHASVVEVKGIGKFERYSGTLQITREDLEKAAERQREKQEKALRAEPRVAAMARLTSPPTVDGKLGDLPPPAAVFGKRDKRERNRLVEGVKLRMGYTDAYLYLGYRVKGLGPLKNSGSQWDRLFKTGGAVDLRIATNPAAPPGREAPAAGDVRVLMTRVNGEPRVVLYQPVAPDAPKKLSWHAESPVDEVTFDRVERLEGARLGHRRENHGYTLEAALPLKALGLRPEPGTRLRFDFGVLATDQSGHAVVRRLNWANKATAMLANVPSEARLHPHLWGHLRVRGQKSAGGAQPEGPSLEGEQKQNEQVSDFLDGVSKQGGSPE